jgi:type II secretory pathway pseudopilin PulG
MGRQMFARGGQVYPMQDGGMAPPMAPPPQQGPAPQMPGMLAMGGQEGVDINAAAQGAMQQGIDPTILEGLLGNYASQMEDLDNAQDYETVMNGIRGDQIPVEGRYAELAEVVGQEDAQATPESVLTLLQPVMMMAAVDQGIGGLAQDEMSAPIEGAMAEGIMSTVNMGAPEGPAPVNFSQGGAVQYMAAGGPPLPDSRLQTLFDEQRALTNSIYGATNEEEDLNEQTELTKAQMLFDIAQGALAFASPGDRPMSPAERLAQSFTPVIGNIGARAGELGKFKRAQKDRALSIDMANLQSAQTNYQGELTRAAAAANVKPGDIFKLTDADGTTLWQGPMATVGDQNRLLQKYSTAVNVLKVPDAESVDYVTFIDPNNNSDFLIFDKNNKSVDNVQAMAQAQQAKNEQGGYKYRITGNYTPKTDSDAGTSIINLKNPETGESRTIDLSTADGRLLKDQLLAEGFEKAGVRDLDSPGSTPKIQTVVDRNNPDDVKNFDLNDPAQRKAYKALGSNWIATTMPSLADLANGTGPDLGNGYEARALKLLSDQAILDAYASGTADPSVANMINNYLTKETAVKPAWDNVAGKWISVPGLVLSETVLRAIAERRKINGASLPTLGNKDALELGLDAENNSGRVKFKDGVIDYTTFENDPLYLITGIDLTASQGAQSSINRFFNLIAGQVKDVTGVGSGYMGEGGKITSSADRQLNALARRIVSTARSGVEGRVFAIDVDMLKAETDGFISGGFTTDNAARDQLVVVRNNLAMMYSEAQSIKTSPGDAKTIGEATRLQYAVENLIAETTAAIAVYDRFIGGDPISNVMSDRAATSSVTGGLSRASSGSSQ